MESATLATTSPSVAVSEKLTAVFSLGVLFPGLMSTGAAFTSLTVIVMD
jgi:hypothetical protein